MIALPLLLLAVAGMALNLGFSQPLAQPDWAMAVFLAAVLAHRGAWLWVAPGALAHDLIFYQSPWGLLPWVLAFPWLMAHLDFRLGPGLPQRVALMLLGLMPAWWYGWQGMSWWFTMLCVIPLWYYLAEYYARRA